MKVSYVYCHHCGREEFDTSVALGGKYSNGLFVLCNGCKEETSDFDDAVQEEDSVTRHPDQQLVANG